jgi:hypothetical protein
VGIAQRFEQEVPETVLPECMVGSVRFHQVVGEVKRDNMAKEEWEVNM